MKILVLDNYDSFTYNLVQYITELTGFQPDVFRNDKIRLEEVDKYDCIVLSPGPGLPKDAGIMPELIKTYSPTKRILGVCLGHQAIGEAFGAELYNLSEVYHGIASPIKVTQPSDVLYKNVPSEITVGRYHSWAIVRESLPAVLTISSETEDGTIMSISHKDFKVLGVQYHPESVMTPYGKQIIKNFLMPTGVKSSHVLEYVF
jgi:anthranilate synthase component II